MQRVLEDMLFSEQVTRNVFSTDGARYAAERGLTPREHGLLLAPGIEAYARARTVTTEGLLSLLPASVVVLRSAGVDVEQVFGSFFDSDAGQDHEAAGRPDALVRYLLEQPTCARAWTEPARVLLAWELAMVSAPPHREDRAGVRLRTGVRALEQPWDMPALVHAIVDAGRWVDPSEERSWYALVSDRLPGLGGRARVWSVGPLLGTFLLDIDHGTAMPDLLSPLEQILLEECLAAGLVHVEEA